MEERLAIEAVVEDFAEDVMTDHYASGASASYHATVLRIESPERLAGRALTIFHDQELPAGSPWREIGRGIRFKILESLLASEDVLFVGAVEDLRVRDSARSEE
jgi:hypothetical protein